MSGIQNVTFLENRLRNTFGYTAYDSTTNTIVVVFRGTNEPRNWLTNLSTVLTQWKNHNSAKAHQGFYNAYMAIRDELKDQLRDLLSKYPSAEILFTGHSLGGALAMIAAADIK